MLYRKKKSVKIYKGSDKNLFKNRDTLCPKRREKQMEKERTA
jgi:hypothetical protein